MLILSFLPSYNSETFKMSNINVTRLLFILVPYGRCNEVNHTLARREFNIYLII